MQEPTHAVRLSRPPIAILGVPFDNVNTKETLALIAEMIASRQPHYMVTANVDFVVQAREDIELRRILFDAHLVVADGMPLVWASKWLGNPLPERVTGSGLTPLMLAEAETKGWRVFFLGGTDVSVAQAAANTRAKYPKLQLVGAYSPPFKPLIEMDHKDIRRRILEARPDILLVAFGCPKQEKWLNMHYRTIEVPVSIGVGATIDFLAGTMKRAPQWMQKTGLEWLFRLLQEPRRLFRRYVTDLWVFGSAIFKQYRILRARKVPCKDATAKITEARDAGIIFVKMPPRFDAAATQSNGPAWQSLISASMDLVLEFENLEFIDSTGIAALIRLQKSARADGRHLVLAASNPVLERALQLMKLKELFSVTKDINSALSLVAGRRRECNVVRQFNAIGNEDPVKWQGEITAVNVEAVAQATMSGLAHAEYRLAVDLSGVRFIDSSGIGLMVKLKKEANRRNVLLEFVDAPQNVRNVAHLLRLDAYLLKLKT